MHPSSESQRDHALDSVRATAMLLGVVYHTMIFRMFIGGSPGGPPGMGGPARYLQDWLHSFRMPLFFLISGYFGRMMLRKYGTLKYLQKRWYRIGMPLVLGMFTFGPAYILTRDALSGGPAFGGGPPRGGALVSDDDMPPPPPGFVPPPLAKFDEDGDGSLNAAEWKKARALLDQTLPSGGPPRGGPGRPPGFGPGGPPGGPGSPRRGGPPPGPFGERGGLSESIFGSYARLFELHHLWFLWYLLVFATIAPWLTNALGSLVRFADPRKVDAFGARIVRSGLAPVFLGALATPALLAVPGMFGWYLGLQGAIFRAFPDFLLHVDPDMGFFLVFFLAGWWLHREREALPSLAGLWPVNFVVGLITFAVAIWLSDTYSRRIDAPNYQLIRVAGYALYSLSSAATGFAFIGFFQKYFKRQSTPGRYLADTALWVYLVHQPLVIVGLACFVPLGLPWWALTAIVSVLAVAGCLLLYEAVVRPTPLVYLFGPASARPNRDRDREGRAIHAPA